MKQIYLYTGKGAYQAKDVENFLAVFGYDYLRLSEHDLNQPEAPGIFIVPGGQISSILSAWGPNGIEAIRNFILSGNDYIGICAGVYVAGKAYNGIKGLNLFNVELPHTERQSIIDVKDSENRTYQLVQENAPELTGIPTDEILLTDADERPQAIKLHLGKGRVFLFASHLEGSVYYGQLPQNFSGAKYFDSFIKNLLDQGSGTVNSGI